MALMRQFDSGATRNLDSPIEIAWAAGLFEGEGCATLDKIAGRVRKNGSGGDRIYQYPRLTLNLTDEDVINHFAEVVGGKVNGPYEPRGSSKKQFWTWFARGKEAVRVIHLLRPLMGARRSARMGEVLEIWGQK